MELLVENFFSFLRNDKLLSESTINSYKRDLNLFERFLGRKLEYAIESDIKSYITGLKNSGKSTSTISRAMVSLRSFFGYCHNIGFLKINPVEFIKLPKAEKKLPEILTSEEVEILLGQPTCIDEKGYRDKAMLELLYATGIKVSELIGLNLTSINLRRRILYCNSSGNIRMVPVGKKAVSAISDYLKSGRNALVCIKDEQALFVNCYGSRMTRQGFWKIVKSYKYSAGINKEITPHMLRHSFAAHMLQNGADLSSIGEMMGLTDIASTAIYKKILENKIFDVYDKAHPRA